MYETWTLVVVLICLLLATGFVPRGNPFGRVAIESESRPSDVSALNAFLSQVAIIAALLAGWHQGWWTAHGVGFAWGRGLGTSPHDYGLGEGVISVLVGVLSYIGLEVFRQRDEAVRPVEVLGRLGSAWPRSKVAKLLLVFEGLACAVTEELVLRGIFVFAVHRASGSAALAMCLGLAATLIPRGYQGMRQAWSNALIHIVMVATVYSPFGLLAAIGCHVAANVHQFYVVRQDFVWAVDHRHSAS